MRRFIKYDRVYKPENGEAEWPGTVIEPGPIYTTVQWDFSGKTNTERTQELVQIKQDYPDAIE
jgi:hypothetical protein